MEKFQVQRLHHVIIPAWCIRSIGIHRLPAVFSYGRERIEYLSWDLLLPKSSYPTFPGSISCPAWEEYERNIHQPGCDYRSGFDPIKSDDSEGFTRSPIDPPTRFSRERQMNYPCSTEPTILVFDGAMFGKWHLPNRWKWPNPDLSLSPES